MDQFFHFFENLTMPGPGDDRITEDLIRSTNTKQTPLILDIGSGTGRQTRILAASAPEGRIVPVERYIPYLQKVQDIQQSHLSAEQWNTSPSKQGQSI
jgi:tRNA G46 methylase TrmB